jgi:hypothetical protein
MKSGIIYLAGAAAAMTLGAQCASAANLITNGGFETGDFTGWTVVANATGVTGPGFDGFNPHSGNFFANLGDTSGAYPFGTLSQTISTVAGQLYTLSFYLSSDGALPNYFDVNWNGTLVTGSALTNVPDQRPNYTLYSFNLLGTGSDTLLFHEQNIPAYWALDDVSLDPAGTTGGVPEPATWAMMLLGFGIVGGAMRARRQRVRVRFAF